MTERDENSAPEAAAPGRPLAGPDVATQASRPQLRPRLPNGPAAAAVLAAAIACCVLGLAVTLAAASETLNRALTWSTAVGPLSGKTSVAVIAYLIAWPLLHVLWRRRDLRFGTVLVVSFVLIALGILGTFPPFFEQFEH